MIHDLASSVADRRLACRLLRSEGLTASQIGAQLDIPASTVRNLWTEANCLDCGTPIDASSKREAPERCFECAIEHRRIWTRELIIIAIQRWAMVHGRPPHAYDWLRADPRGRWPAFSSVYGRRGRFDYWSDAIEAAGFARPKPGCYDRSGEIGLGKRARLILSSLSDGPRSLRELSGAKAKTPAYMRVVQSIHHLRGRGLVVRIRPGLYALADTATAQAVAPRGSS